MENEKEKYKVIVDLSEPHHNKRMSPEFKEWLIEAAMNAHRVWNKVGQPIRDDLLDMHLQSICPRREWDNLITPENINKILAEYVGKLEQLLLRGEAREITESKLAKNIGKREERK